MAFIKKSKEGREDFSISQIYHYLRFKRQFWGVITEINLCGNDLEDLIAFKENEILAVEMKTSKSDFLRDFATKEKYHNGFKNLNYFAFFLPYSLAHYAEQKLQDMGLDKIGIYSITGSQVIQFKTPKLLNPKISIFEEKTLAESLIKRLSSDNFRLHKQTGWNKNGRSI